LHRSLLPAAIALFGLASGCFAGGGSASVTSQPGRLADRVVGWSLAVPEGWSTGGRVYATAFASAGRCRSAFVLDRRSPGESGPGPSVSRSFVQVCARPADGRSLRAFLVATYGDGFTAQFEPVRIDRQPAFRTRHSQSALVFVQTRDHRLQLASSVTPFPEDRDRRRAQVDRVLESFRLGTRTR
jgi:hypothetical protein